MKYAMIQRSPERNAIYNLLMHAFNWEWVECFEICIWLLKNVSLAMIRRPSCWSDASICIKQQTKQTILRKRSKFNFLRTHTYQISILLVLNAEIGEEKKNKTMFLIAETAMLCNFVYFLEYEDGKNPCYQWA